MSMVKGSVHDLESMQNRDTLCWRWIHYTELYLLGIRVLSRQLSEKELHEMVSLMMEKEIRMRCPIDDTLLGGDDGDIDDYEKRMIEDE